MLILRRVPRRGARVSAALTTAESVTALVVAHTAAGGTIPDAAWLIPAAALVYGVSTLVFSGRGSIRALLPVLVALQLFLHAWLTTLSGHAHAEHAGVLLGMTAPMLAAHVAAGAVTALAWLLRRRAVDVLVAWVDSTPGPIPLLPASAIAAPPWLRLHGRALTVAPTRGPPSGVPAAA